MKRLLLLFLTISLLLASCGGLEFDIPPEKQKTTPEESAEQQDLPQEIPAYELEEDEFPEVPPEEVGPPVYEPRDGLTPHEVVEAYLDQLYESYATLTYIDLTALQDMTSSAARNAELWYEMLTLRRRLLDETGLCYVSTDRYNYELIYLDEDEVEDDRTSFWTERGQLKPQHRQVHFTLKGEEGAVYPPMFAPGSQHTVRLGKVEGEWRIIFHYYPGAVRRYRNGAVEWKDEDAMLEGLRLEFAQLEAPDHKTATDTAGIPYDGTLAAEYALRYTESPNENFYKIGDWMGNCANFTSQCMWYGFTGGADNPAPHHGRMTDDWYGGEGGGTPAWENVEYFWAWATGSGQLKYSLVEGVTALQAGDMIQLRTGNNWDETEDERENYNHTLLVIDGETLLLAQNSPGCFTYYSDMVHVKARLLRPQALLA